MPYGIDLQEFSALVAKQSVIIVCEMIRYPFCMTCKHRLPPKFSTGLRCLAFTEGIPKEILVGGVSHKEPYPNDGGYIYEYQDLKDRPYQRKEMEELLDTDDAEYLPYVIRVISDEELNPWGEALVVGFINHPIDYVKREAIEAVGIMAREMYPFQKSLLLPVLEKLLAERKGKHWYLAVWTACQLEVFLEWQLNAKALSDEENKNSPIDHPSYEGALMYSGISSRKRHKP